MSDFENIVVDMVKDLVNTFETKLPGVEYVSASFIVDEGEVFIRVVAENATDKVSVVKSLTEDEE